MTSGGIPVSVGGTGTRVAAQTTVDMSLSVDLGKLDDHGVMRGLTLGVDVINLLNNKPAYAQVGAPIVQNFDSSTGSALGQTISFRITKAF